MRIEAGKRYVTRSGWITAPIEEDLDAEENDTMRFYCGDSSWRHDGRVFRSGDDNEDLISEFVEVAPVKDMPDTDEMLVLDSIEKLGGQFTQRLAYAYRFADPANRQKIRNTFREYWIHYLTIAHHEKTNSNG